MSTNSSTYGQYSQAGRTIRDFNTKKKKKTQQLLLPTDDDMQMAIAIHQEYIQQNTDSDRALAEAIAEEELQQDFPQLSQSNNSNEISTVSATQQDRQTDDNDNDKVNTTNAYLDAAKMGLCLLRLN